MEMIRISRILMDIQTSDMTKKYSVTLTLENSFHNVSYMPTDYKKLSKSIMF